MKATIQKKKASHDDGTVLSPLSFLDYIEEFEENVEKLIGLLPAEETEELYLDTRRALWAALQRRDVSRSIRYLQLIQRLRSKWFSNKSTLLSDFDDEFDREYQWQVQRFFREIIVGCSDQWEAQPNEYTEYTAKDLEDIIALGADIRGRTSLFRHDCALVDSAESACPIGIFKALVKAGAPYTSSRYHGTPLQVAANAGRTDIMEFLLNRNLHSLNVNINEADAAFQTVLHGAARTCDTKVIHVLLQHPEVEVDVMDDDYTPFLLAVKAHVSCRDKRAAIQKFIDFKPANSFRLSRTKENGLHLAADFRDATLSILLRYVKDVNAQDWVGETPLHRAVRAESKPNVQLLLRHGADPTITDDRGYTPLQLACDKRHLGSMEALLSLPQNLVNQWPDAKGINSDSSAFTLSPITRIFGCFYVVGKGKRPENARRALELVLAARPDLEARDSSGRSVLSRMITVVDSEDLILDLLRAGADVNSQDNKGNTPLHMVLSCSPHIKYWKVKLLLEWGADPDINNKNGQNPVTANSIPHRVEQWEKKIAAIIERNKLRTTKDQ